MTQERRALVVSHPCVVPANQSVYAALADRGWALDLVVPAQWRHEYAEGLVPAAKLPELRASFHPRPVVLPGQPQRHFYPRGCARFLRARRPPVAFLEEETFSVPAFQWGLACWRRGIPFGVQADENLDRALPPPARLFRKWVLQHAAFVAARSPAAKQLLESFGARGRVEVIPHAVPGWLPAEVTRRSDLFTVGYAGRFVDEKGIFDLLDAAARVSGRVRVLLVGNGRLREELETSRPEGVELEIQTEVKHEQMPSAFAEMDVLVLPSRTTRTWVEQFGRVLVEALWCGVPVVGSSSGEIPWVVEVTGGGVVFPEGDIRALADALERLRQDGDERRRLAREGRAAVERLFSAKAVARQLDEIMSTAVHAPIRA